MLSTPHLPAPNVMRPNGAQRPRESASLTGKVYSQLPRTRAPLNAAFGTAQIRS
ncbi:hypothetical protein HNR05_000356 [Leifsonia psychrotolerans]|uniref:Uncharacterized protein n=1 Tax=Glaciibacter psychrotolerans TaxID=670054 RepID=A0A7Z0ECB9_9MICO|nr:hypothetical protein [Leifsonia psychrotolerans]